MTTPEFGVLGTVEVRAGDRPVSLGGRRGQAIVAALLVEANRIVTVDQLVAAAWGDRPPETARVQAQNRISRLRGVLRACGCESVIITVGSGYILRAGEEQPVDHRWRDLRADTRNLSGRTVEARLADTGIGSGDDLVMVGPCVSIQCPLWTVVGDRGAILPGSTSCRPTGAVRW